ncbi:phage integrase family protein [Cupriavidus metallidurans]|uniref:phage integrase family protein n=1 Tax=Cupriavidus metallidurans TaxID=119219 RepID=UPI000CE0759A|nr:phage integrase family protein [Cupriavidus metallidurans]AVA33665.1 integrase [Cupriavidus metallidurans]
MRNFLITVDFPDAAPLAALRAWYAGASSRQAVERYCPDTLGAGRSARGVLGAIRRQLAEFARQRRREDLATLFRCGEAERQKYSKAVTRALESLRSLPIPEPQISDPITWWLPTRVAVALHAHGIGTLADLTVRVPRRRRWWAAIAGLGAGSARRVEAFFAAHPGLTERARALIAAAPPAQIVPWEQIRLPHELDGARGSYRAPRQMCTLDAGNDYEAISAWLTLHESAETTRAYRREAERLLLWAIVERGKALSSLATEDAIAYRAFLRRPTPHQHWVAPARPRASSEWRPFTGGLSPRSIAYALSVMGAMFRWLIAQRYVLANPFAGVKVRGARRAAGLDASRAFTAGEWELIRAIADGLEWSYGWSVPAAQRLRFLLDFGYATGLRAGELVGVTLGGIEIGARGERWLHLVGKGAKPGKVALPPLARHALDQYLAQRGLPVTPAHWKPDMPLLANLQGTVAITTPRLRDVLRRFFRLAADAIETDHPALAEKLDRATPHWMRHTHATQALAQGATLTTVRDNLRHASITTTSTYLHDDEMQRSQQLEQAFGRRR